MVADCYLAGVSARRMDKRGQTLRDRLVVKVPGFPDWTGLDEHVEPFRHHSIRRRTRSRSWAADALTMKGPRRRTG